MGNVFFTLVDFLVYHEATLKADYKLWGAALMGSLKKWLMSALAFINPEDFARV